MLKDNFSPVYGFWSVSVAVSHYLFVVVFKLNPQFTANALI